MDDDLLISSHILQVILIAYLDVFSACCWLHTLFLSKTLDACGSIVLVCLSAIAALTYFNRDVFLLAPYSHCTLIRPANNASEISVQICCRLWIFLKIRKFLIGPTHPPLRLRTKFRANRTIRCIVIVSYTSCCSVTFSNLEWPWRVISATANYGMANILKLLDSTPILL